MGDLISREAAISAMYLLQIEDEETYGGCSIPEGFDGERAAEALRKLPSAEPERTAKVIDKSVGRHSIFDFDWSLSNGLLLRKLWTRYYSRR